MYRNIAAIVLCHLALLGPATAQCPPPPPKPSCPVPAENVKSVEQGVGLALQCEWLQTPGAVLDALGLFVTYSETDANGKPKIHSPEKAASLALQKLIAAAPKGDGYASYEDLFRAALGVPTPNGQPTAPALTSFLATLEKSNRLMKDPNQPQPGEAECIKPGADLVITRIFQATGGPESIQLIKQAFDIPDNQLALYRLLESVPNDPVKYAADLETIRALFAARVSDLSKLVNNRFQSPKN